MDISMQIGPKTKILRILYQTITLNLLKELYIKLLFYILLKMFHGEVEIKNYCFFPHNLNR